MCGIFGLSCINKAKWEKTQISAMMKDLFLFSESRGKEAAGCAIWRDQHIEVLKSPVAASKMLRTRKYQHLIQQTLQQDYEEKGQPFACIGHSRLVTTGSQYSAENNQPVIAGQMVGVHNGIIVNYNSLWQRHPKLQRQYQVDTEIIFQLIRTHYTAQSDLIKAVRLTFQEIEGTASLAVFFEDFDLLLLATNNGSLYYSPDVGHTSCIFASERYILQQILQRSHCRPNFASASIRHIKPGTACFVDIHTANIQVYSFHQEQSTSDVFSFSAVSHARKIIEHTQGQNEIKPLNAAQKSVGLSEVWDERQHEYLNDLKQRFPHETAWQDSLKRCTKCILPETMPFIEFDEKGVCNYCRNYQKLQFYGKEKLEAILKPHLTDSGEPDCVVGISGGRDSLYCLHYIKNELNMNPIAYTYDWGMVTDLARRNISRICAKLGIEHILVSADITRKRKFIKKNVTAWLKKPELGMIPLFMAGDKQYFYYLQQVQKQVGVHLTIFGENMLERTDFKTGFAGVAPYNKDANHVYTMPLSSKIQLALYYGSQYLKNPRYINRSLLDSFWAYGCYYLLKQHYVNVYNYIPWIEDEIISLLRREYDFELASDSATTWRIGDGTAAFYNYIYYTVAGFTENETFRSNQIREGLLTREEALKRVREENKPRYETIYWYLNIIDLDLDMKKVFEMINAIPKLSTH